MNSNLDFLVLMKKTRDHMEENNYSYTSVTCYMRTWRSVYCFGISKGITRYSAALAEQYMLERYHVSIGENEINHQALSPYMAQKVRALRALTDFMLHGYVPKLTRGEQVVYAACSFDPDTPVTVSAIASYLDMTDRTVRDWLKEMSDEYQNDRGVVTHI